MGTSIAFLFNAARRWRRTGGCKAEVKTVIGGYGAPEGLAGRRHLAGPPAGAEAREGGESTWALWHEAERQLDEAFAPTQPSDQAPLGPVARKAEPSGPPTGYETADELMVIARRNNRVCPNPAEWSRLYQLLEGDRFIDLQPPPVEQWMWGKLSHLQKRMRFREHVEWAERHGRLGVVAGFVHSLAEADWLHMG